MSDPSHDQLRREPRLPSEGDGSAGREPMLPLPDPTFGSRYVAEGLSGCPELHDGGLMECRFDGTESLLLCVRLDPVWNRVITDIVEIRLAGVENAEEVRSYFQPLWTPKAANAEVWMGCEPTVLSFEVLPLDGRLLVSLELLFLGTLQIICGRAEVGGRATP